jgi:hypothetical protein
LDRRAFFRFCCSDLRAFFRIKSVCLRQAIYFIQHSFGQFIKVRADVQYLEEVGTSAVIVPFVEIRGAALEVAFGRAGDDTGYAVLEDSGGHCFRAGNFSMGAGNLIGYFTAGAERPWALLFGVRSV